MFFSMSLRVVTYDVKEEHDKNSNSSFSQRLSPSSSIVAPLPFWAAAPKGSMTYAFTHTGDFLLLFLLLCPPPLKSQSRGQNSSLKAKIPVSRPKSQSRSPNPSLEARIWALRLGSGPQGWNLGLETGILALRLEFRPRD